MEYSPASKLQVNMNGFSGLLRILRSARQSGRVSIELPAVDGAQVEEPWRAYLLLVDGEVTTCSLYRKADGQRVLIGDGAMLWLHSLGQRELLWGLEPSAPRQQKLSSLHTPTSLLPSPSPAANGQAGSHATTHPLLDPRPAPPLQTRSHTAANPLSVPRLLPSPQSSPRSVTEPLSESSPLVDSQAQMEPRTTTNPPFAPPIIDLLPDTGSPVNDRTGPRTTNSLSEQHPAGSQRTFSQRPVVPQSESFASINWLAPSVLTQIPYRIAPVEQEMETWSRRHRRVFLLIDGTRSVVQIADMLGLPPATGEQIVADLLSWGVVLCI